MKKLVNYIKLSLWSNYTKYRNKEDPMGFRKFLTGIVVGVAGTIGLSLYLYIKDNDSIIFDFVANTKNNDFDSEEEK